MIIGTYMNVGAGGGVEAGPCKAIASASDLGLCWLWFRWAVLWQGKLDMKWGPKNKLKSGRRNYNPPRQTASLDFIRNICYVTGMLQSTGPLPMVNNA